MRALLALLLASPALAQVPLPPPDGAEAPSVTAASAPRLDPEVERRRARAAAVTIVRDDFGIAHVEGVTDADSVFGMIYAQAEDDFPRIETNYLNALGRLAEAEGESGLWSDLRMRLWIDPVDLEARYAAAPDWLQALCTAWADGLNHYLATHPAAKPRALTHFEPWMALAFSEGSIGADYESVPVPGIAAFYGKVPVATLPPAPVRLEEPAGSNGFAIAPAKSADGSALLLINPHTSFYFRSEAQVRSRQGLDVYGASTWGQFFVYQGFNRHLGWMHTTSGVDRVDEFSLAVRQEADGSFSWRDGAQWRAFDLKPVTLRYRAADGSLRSRSFTTWHTPMGPVTRAADGRWIATSLMFKPVEALMQSWLRTKAADLGSYLQVAKLRANSSNNTLVATDQGRIALLLPQFIARRDPRFDYRRVVDGSDPASRWQGEHGLDELPQVIDPASGWVMNVNNRPWTAGGPGTLDASRYPAWFDMFGENAREAHAIKVLSEGAPFSLDGLIAAAYDPFLPPMAALVPTLIGAVERLPGGDARKARLAAPLAALRAWDFRWGEESVATTLAVLWAEKLAAVHKAAAREDEEYLIDYLARVPSDAERVALLEAVIADLNRDFGRWQTPWGEINRLQRPAPGGRYDDSAPSLPIGFTSANWGSLAAYGAASRDGSKRWYGAYGNSFVAVVSFGPKGPVAKAVSVGGESGDPASAHFFDQAERYRRHQFRDVYLTGDALKAHAARVYHPGE